MKPAYHIALSPRELRAIGNLCAIQGQIEWAMLITVKRLLGLTIQATQALMGATSIAKNADIWRQVVNEKMVDPEAIAWAEYAYREIAHITRDRNDFVHAIYGVRHEQASTPSQWVLLESKHSKFAKGRMAVAARVRNFKERDSKEILEAEKRAAKVSIITAHILSITWGEDDKARPFKRRLGSRLPPA